MRLQVRSENILILNYAWHILMGKKAQTILSISSTVLMTNINWVTFFVVMVVIRQTIQYFGDVITFEATYHTNVYHNPLVVIVGINHHYKTTIFVFALLTAETEQAYTWLLVTLLDAMEGKHPKVVLTDGDKAMRKAISKKLLQLIRVVGILRGMHKQMSTK